MRHPNSPVQATLLYTGLVAVECVQSIKLSNRFFAPGINPRWMTLLCISFSNMCLEHHNQTNPVCFAFFCFDVLSQSLYIAISLPNNFQVTRVTKLQSSPPPSRLAIGKSARHGQLGECGCKHCSGTLGSKNSGLPFYVLLCACHAGDIQPANALSHLLVMAMITEPPNVNCFDFTVKLLNFCRRRPPLQGCLIYELSITWQGSSTIATDVETIIAK